MLRHLEVLIQGLGMRKEGDLDHRRQRRDDGMRLQDALGVAARGDRWCRCLRRRRYLHWRGVVMVLSLCVLETLSIKCANSLLPRKSCLSLLVGLLSGF